MKKLLATLLAMVMALSLAAPAFADGPDGPASDPSGIYTVNGEAVPVYKPGDAIPINAILGESLGIIGGADGPTAIFTAFPGLGELDFTDLESALLDVDQYLADHPGLEEQLKASAYVYFAKQYADTWTAEEYMELMGQTEEEFLNEMVWAQAWDLMSKEAWNTAADALKESLGGVPGQVGVMVNGTYVQFSDASPEVRDGTTMAPVRALAEALGGEVEAKNNKVICTFDGMAVAFEMNGFDVEIEHRYPGSPPKTQFVTMPVAAYVKGGRTYVPVRFLAETLGYEVGWDGLYQTVVLLDREALAAEIDKDFTIINRVQANQGPALGEGESLQADAKGKISITAFDTLHGNKTYEADFTSRLLKNAEAASGTYSLKMSDNIAELLIGQYEEDMDEGVLARMRLVLDALEDAEVIMTREGLLWTHAPALDELGGEENIWCGMDMDQGELQTIFGGESQATMGQALAAMAPVNSVVWPSASAPASALAELCRDEKFTTGHGVSTLTIGAEELSALYGSLGMSGIEDELEEFSLTLKVDSKGEVTADCVMETAAWYGTPAMRITISSTQSAGTVSLTVKYHIANRGEAALTFTVSQSAVSGKPMTEPPEGATVVDAPELLNGYGEFSGEE